MAFHVPEKFRITTGPLQSSPVQGNNGAFRVRQYDRVFHTIASDGSEAAEEGLYFPWEHVSVSLPNRPNQTPSWEDMCFIKSVFWDAEDVVIQIHPAKSEHISHHAGCLHLWRFTGADFPLPHYAAVAPKPGESAEEARLKFEAAAKPKEKETD